MEDLNDLLTNFYPASCYKIISYFIYVKLELEMLTPLSLVPRKNI